MATTIDAVLDQFAVPGAFLKAERFGSGLINDTYRCECIDGAAVRAYLLQRINTAVFQRPDLVMENVAAVTSHIAGRLRAMGVRDPYRFTPALIPTRDGRLYHLDAQKRSWRLFHFIESGVVFDTVRGSEHAFEVGRGLGAFHRLVSDLPPLKLHETIPGFHRTPRYLEEYRSAMRDDPRARAAEAAAEQAFVDRRRACAAAVTALLDEGKIPLRVAHNDPKVNNILIHAETGKALCMVDLDTVMPGTVLYDFGDCVRSAANPAGEDAQNPRDAKIDLALVAALTKGYLEEAGEMLTEREVELLPLSVKVITFELGLRFLTDHLLGDVYFKIRYPGHNLHRARVQFRLLESIEAAEDTMAEIVRACVADLLARSPGRFP